MANWTDILADASEYGDEVEVQLGDTKLSLKDLRGLIKADKQAVSEEQARVQAKQKELESREEQVASIWANLNDIAKQTAGATGGTVAQGSTNSPTGTSTIDYEHDALLGPLWKSSQEAKAEAARIKQMLDGNQNQSAHHVAALYESVWDSEWKRNQWPTEKLADAKKYAVENRITNKAGVIDPIQAYDRMTASERLESRIKQEREAAAAEGYAKAKAEFGTSILPFATGKLTADKGAQAQVKIDPNADMAANIRANLQRVLAGQAR